MRSIILLVFAVVASFLLPVSAQAQCDGLFATGTICGNVMANPASPLSSLPSAFGIPTLSGIQTWDGTKLNTFTGVVAGNDMAPIKIFNTSATANSTASIYYQTGVSPSDMYRVGVVNDNFDITIPGVAQLFDINRNGAAKVYGTLSATITSVATTSSVCYNTGSGLFTYNATVGTCTVSDGTLKNIEGPIAGALDRVLQVHGVYYNYKDSALYGTGRQVGVIAQNVETVFPELVSTDSNGIKSVDYQKLVAPIIEAIRELKADNDNLRACQQYWRCRIFGR